MTSGVVGGAPGSTANRATLEGGRLFRTWTIVVSIGESVGFLVPAAAAVPATNMPVALAVPLVLVAGAVEGAVLGAAQQSVLRRALPELRAARWIALTASAAVAAYVLGFVMSYLGGIGTWAAWAALVGIGGLLLCTIGVAQQTELRRYVRRSGRWIGWTAAGWLVGLAAFNAVAMPLWHAGQQTSTAIVIGAGAGVVMAVSQAAITGWGLVRMLADRSGDALDGPGPW